VALAHAKSLTRLAGAENECGAPAGRVYHGPSKNFTSGDGSMGDLLQPWHMIVLFVILAPITVVVIPPFWMIFKKAGFQPILSVLMLVPLVNLILIYFVAFSEWKAGPAQR
jgi:hypothetical protein